MSWTLTTPSGLCGEIRLEDWPQTHVAYVRHIGPYAGDSHLFRQLYERLFGWAGPRGLLRFPETRAICVYHDDPHVTEPEKHRVSACITLPGPTEGSDQVGIMTLSGGPYAMGRFRLGPPDYAEAWDCLIGYWLPRSGFLCTEGMPFELYVSHCDESDQRAVVDICLPVVPL